MKKTRVPKGEKYWFIDWDGDILWQYDDCNYIDDKYYNIGNYFHTKEEAELVAKKILAVLNGADVIEMPSDVEIKYLYPPQITNDEDAEFHEGMRVGVSNTIDVFKSKIIK